MRLPCLLVLSLAAASRAQKSEPPPNPDEQLLVDLGNDEKCMDAVRTLAHRGPPGVATLMAAIRDPQFHADERRLATAIYALGKMGDTAAPAATLLLDEVDAASGSVLRNLYWALGEVGPKAQASGADVLGRLRGMKPQPGWTHQEWAFACRRIELGLELDNSQLRTMLGGPEQATILAAAAFLLRQQPGTAVPRDELLAAWSLWYRQWGSQGEGARRLIMELARAVVRFAGDASEGTQARAALIYHFDVEVRLQAVMQIGQSPGDGDVGVKALEQSLTDGSVQVRREAVTALGMIGPPAACALPALQALAKDPDLQIRNRAAAAVRAIGRTGK